MKLALQLSKSDLAFFCELFDPLKTCLNLRHIFYLPHWFFSSRTGYKSPLQHSAQKMNPEKENFCKEIILIFLIFRMWSILYIFLGYEGIINFNFILTEFYKKLKF